MYGRRYKTASCDNGCSEKDTVNDPDSKLGHKFTEYVSDGNATCTEDGTKTASCDNGCGEKDTVDDPDSKLGHKFTEYVSDGNATCTEDGTKTASCDNGCNEKDTVTDTGSKFGHADDDKDGECDRCHTDMTVEYRMLKGDGANWAKGSNKSLTFKSEAEYSLFRSVEIDGTALSENEFEATEGSTVIKVKSSKLESLDMGEHTIKIVSKNGSAKGTFRIVKGSYSVLPVKTGYTNYMYIYIILAAAATAGIIMTIRKANSDKA